MSHRNHNRLHHIPEPTEEHHKNIVKKPIEKSWQPKIANLIAFFALVISAILALYTYKVFELSSAQSVSVIKSAKAAVDAAQTAKNTLVETKKYNDSSIAIQKRTFESNNIDAVERYERETAAFNLQVNSSKQVQRQFEINNAPYLQIASASMSAPTIGQPIDVGLSFENLGNYPVKIISSKFAASTRHLTPDINILENSNNSLPVSIYVVKGHVLEQTFKQMIPVLSQDTYNNLVVENYFLFIVGHIEYQNLVNGKLRVYKFILKLKPDNSQLVYFVLNENKDNEFKKKK